MSKSEILAELPQLSPSERHEVMERLWQIEEQKGPTDAERRLLDEAQADFDATGDEGKPWREVIDRS